jgi:hypothetical protein
VAAAETAATQNEETDEEDEQDRPVRHHGGRHCNRRSHVHRSASASPHHPRQVASDAPVFM